MHSSQSSVLCRCYLFILVQVMQIECHVKDNKGMVPDTVAMVADFELLGEGLVKKVEVVSYTP